MTPASRASPYQRMAIGPIVAMTASMSMTKGIEVYSPRRASQPERTGWIHGSASERRGS